MDVVKLIVVILIILIIFRWFTSKKDEHLSCTKSKTYKTPDNKDKEPCENDCECNKNRKCLEDANKIKKCV
jgi:hypothetical protein